jgi:hypothetical protein
LLTGLENSPNKSIAGKSRIMWALLKHIFYYFLYSKFTNLSENTNKVTLDGVLKHIY